MKMEKYLSGVELYYSINVDRKKNQITLDSDEFKHIVKVMRHREGDLLYVTDGLGKIYESRIDKFSKASVIVKIENSVEQSDEFNNITFCIPILKEPRSIKICY